MKQTPFILSVQIPADAPMYDPTHAAQIVRLADAAQVDLLVLGEFTAAVAADESAPHPVEPSALEAPAFESIIVAAALAPLTRGVGLVAVVPALHAEPFHVARAMSALDFLAAGRSGWMPTTSSVDWARYGDVGRVPVAEYLAKGLDFIAATESLWDGWDSDALIIDQATGAYLHTDRVRRSNHHGSYHEVQGPLNAARPPQGYPLQLRSDLDLLGRESGAAVRHADVTIVDSDAPPSPGGSRRIARVAARAMTAGTLAAFAARFERGDIDGLHLTLGDPLDDLAWVGASIVPMLRALGLSIGTSRDRSLRERFGLPMPRSAAEAARRGVAA